jgi:CBS domain-containing protein
MSDAPPADASRPSVPQEPEALLPPSEGHRLYSDPFEAERGSGGFSRAPRGVPGSDELFASARALLESVTLGEYLEGREARRSDPERVTTLDVTTTADEALRVLAKTGAHGAPLVDRDRRAFLGFVDVDDLLSGFFAHVERAVPPPSMPSSEFAESFARDEGRRRWTAGVDKTSLASAVEAFTTSTLADLRRLRAGNEDGRMVYRGARDASLLELARSGFLRAVAKPAVPSAPTTEVSPEVSTRSFAAPSTVADVPARATTCHRVATYRLRLDAEWRDDAMVVDAVVSQWDLCRFLRDRYAEKKKKSHPLRDSREKTKTDAFHASLRELGMVRDDDDDERHQRVVTVTLRTSVLEAFSKMRAAGVSCAGVTSGEWPGQGRSPLVGVVTATDFRVAFCGPGETRRLPDWVAGELLGSVDAFLYRIRTVRLFWERRATRGSTTENDERFSPSATPATTYLHSMHRDSTFLETVDALVSNRTHHVFVVDSFHGNAVRVVTPADVLRAICAPGRSALGWRYKEEDVKKKEKAFADGVRMTDAVGRCLGTLELLDDARRETGEGDAQVGFAGRFDDEM